MNNIQNLKRLGDKDLLAVLIGKTEAEKCQDPLSILFGMQTKRWTNTAREDAAIYAPIKPSKHTEKLMAARELVMRAMCKT